MRRGAIWLCGRGRSHPSIRFDLQYYVSAGDSKTWVAQYQPTLTTLLNVSTGQKWCDVLPRPAWNGLDLEGLVAKIETDLAAIPADITPRYWLLNVGANDVDVLTTEAVTKARWRTYFRAVHTRFSSTPIYVAKVWRRNFGANCTTWNGWLADVMAEPEFVAYVFAGIDETVFLENGDDGATFTSDGIHPNAAGYVLTASAWKTAIGL